MTWRTNAAAKYGPGTVALVLMHGWGGICAPPPHPLIPILVKKVCRNDEIACLSVLLDVIHTRIRELSEENSDSLCLGHLKFSGPCT